MIGKNISVDEILTQFNNRSKLSSLISKYVQLSPRGNSFVGKCPFHNEKTPSFNVNDDKGLFYCFGCKVGGNAITFISKYKNLSFSESIKFLADMLGIEISYENKEQLKKKNNKLFVYKLINDFFKKSLEKNKNALNYANLRIKNKQLISDFEIGFCPDDNELINFLKSEGLSIEEIQETDLLIKNRKNQFFGRFKDRLIFPIFSFSNKVVGFGGREINENSRIKYINSQESQIFKKSELLFGFKQNSEVIRKEKKIILVEGYMDVISLAQSEIRFAVASLGTTLSKTQIQKMWNYSDTPLICFDGDDAGRKSSKNIALKCLEFLVPGKSFKFIKLPEGFDPDTFLKKYSKKKFFELMQSSYNLSDLVWQIILESIDKPTPENIALLDQKIKLLSSKISNRIVSDEYFKFFIKKKNDYLWNLNLKKKKTVHTTEKVQELINEKLVLVFLIFEIELTRHFNEEVSEAILGNKDLNSFKDALFKRNIIEKKKIDLDYLVNNTEYSKQILAEIESLNKTHLKGLNIEEKRVLLRHILDNLKIPILKKEAAVIKKKILEAEDDEEQSAQVNKYNEILKEIKIIQNKELE
ncbi:MAG: DNA primase [Alphaproteobacteria bacterium]